MNFSERLLTLSARADKELSDIFADIERIEFEKSSGAHGGGDAKLLDMIFGGKTDDPLMQTADSFAGFASAMIGIGANESIKTGKAYDLRTALDSLK